MLIDSHCHLDFFNDEEREQIIQNAISSGVEVMQTICTRFSQFDKILKIAESHNFIYASIGTHPENAHDDFVTAEQLIDACNKFPKIIGIGETGLDYYHSIEHKQIQQKCFREHIIASQITRKPLIIHTRNADEDTLKMLTEAKA